MSPVIKSDEFDVSQRQAFYRTQLALEKLLAIQRHVKACAEALRDAPDERERNRLTEEYVALLDRWDEANARYTVANGELLRVLNWQ